MKQWCKIVQVIREVAPHFFFSVGNFSIYLDPMIILTHAWPVHRYVHTQIDPQVHTGVHTHETKTRLCKSIHKSSTCAPAHTHIGVHPGNITTPVCIKRLYIAMGEDQMQCAHTAHAVHMRGLVCGPFRLV